MIRNAGRWPTVEQVRASHSPEQVLRWNRFLPSPRTVGEVAVLDAVVERLGELRAEDPAAMVRASKAIGWDRV
jgi:hypothetical protein